LEGLKGLSEQAVAKLMEAVSKHVDMGFTSVSPIEESGGKGADGVPIP
jgi:hypothetical protein